MSKLERLSLNILGALCVGLSIGSALSMSQYEQAFLLCGIYWLTKG